MKMRRLQTNENETHKYMKQIMFGGFFVKRQSSLLELCLQKANMDYVTLHILF